MDDLGHNAGSLDPVWSPARYPTFSPDQRGSWRVVRDTAGRRVGIIWSNHVGGTGVLWVQQTEEIEKLRRHFTEYAGADVSGEVAYANASNVPDVKFEDEQNGVMQSLYDELDFIMSDFD